MTDVSFQLTRIFPITYTEAYVYLRIALVAILGLNLLVAFAFGE
jgi:hypothetical protein